MIIYDSQTGDDGINMIKLSDKVVFLGLNDSHYCSILDVGKFLYYAKVDYCVKCMKMVKNVFDHICLLRVMCIKCHSIHNDESDGRSVKCSLYDIIFYSEICLRNHFCHKLNVNVKCFNIASIVVKLLNDVIGLMVVGICMIVLNVIVIIAEDIRRNSFVLYEIH